MTYLQKGFKNVDLLADFLYPAFNECIETGKFASCLKQVDITPVFKKGSWFKE